MRNTSNAENNQGREQQQRRSIVVMTPCGIAVARLAVAAGTLNAAIRLRRAVVEVEDGEVIKVLLLENETVNHCYDRDLSSILKFWPTPDWLVFSEKINSTFTPLRTLPHKRKDMYFSALTPQRSSTRRYR